jgi:hypothetical protein
MEIQTIIIYIVSLVCCLIALVLCNYLVKHNKIHNQWKTPADIVWLFSLIPGINVMCFSIMLCVIIYYLTKNFIEQN